AVTVGALDETLRRLRVRVLVEIGNREVSTFPREGDGDGASDPGIAAGEKDFLTLQPATSHVACLAMVGLWDHRCRRAGHGLRLGGEGWLREFRHDAPDERLGAANCEAVLGSTMSAACACARLSWRRPPGSPPAATQ